MKQPNYLKLKITDDILKLARIYVFMRHDVQELQKLSGVLEFGTHDEDEKILTEVILRSEDVSMRAASSIDVLKRMEKKLNIFLKHMEKYINRRI